jgi:hypothetical protein
MSRFHTVSSVSTYSTDLQPLVDNVRKAQKALSDANLARHQAGWAEKRRIQEVLRDAGLAKALRDIEGYHITLDDWFENQSSVIKRCYELLGDDIVFTVIEPYDGYSGFVDVTKASR